MMELSERQIGILEARGLDAEVIQSLGVTGSARGFEWIEIPYVKAGKIVNRKYRTITGEKQFSQDAGAVKCFWNFDVITDATLADQPLLITEGEFDAIVAIQCGFVRSVSVPDGAPAEAQGGDESGRKYSYISDAIVELKEVREIILCTDSDGPGINLLNDLAIRLGRHRCKWVKYPQGCKDLNDAVKKYGVRGVKETVSRAQWMKVGGIYRMSDLPPLPAQKPYPTGMDGMDKHFKLRPGDFVVVTGIPSHGKALALDTPLPTPTGWTTMGAVKEGDELFDERGQRCRVLRTTPVMIGRPCYRLGFSDGSSVVADAEHQWLTVSEKARRSVIIERYKRDGREETLRRGTDQRHKRTFPSVVTTLDIANSLRSQGKWNHQIDNTLAINLPEANLPISPYVLGVWLGDGTSSAGSLCCYEEELKIAVGAEGIYLVPRASDPHMFTMRGIQRTLRQMGVLNHKHIPISYLRSSAPQRIALLQGLMDTDGHCAKDGVCEFTSVSERLARGFYELVCSLGLRASWMEHRAMLSGRDVGPRYRVQFSAPFPVFRLARKLVRQSKPKQHRSKISYRTIVACAPVPSVPVRCIEVDSPSHLYLAGESMIPTHNTSFVNELTCRMADSYGWNIAIASFEQRPQTDHRRNLRTFYNGKYVIYQSADEIERADRWIEERFVFIAPGEDDDVDLAWVLERAQAAVVQYGARMVVIDPWNEMDHVRPRDMSLTEYTGFAIKQFRKLAWKYQIPVLVVAHPTKLRPEKAGQPLPIPTLYDISDSAHWANKADVGIVVHRKDEKTTLIRIQKVKYHDQIGVPGDLEAVYHRDTARYEFILPPAPYHGERAA